MTNKKHNLANLGTTVFLVNKLSLVGIMLVLASCSSMHQQSSQEGLVVDGEDVAIDPFYAVPESGEGKSSLFTSEPTVSKTSSSRNRTVLALLGQAKQQERSGHPEKAAAVIERALRIDPRNAQLWHRLALLRLQQRQYGLAASLAAKSNALAKSDSDLKRKNAQLIQQTRILRGQ